MFRVTEYGGGGDMVGGRTILLREGGRGGEGRAEGGGRGRRRGEGGGGGAGRPILWTEGREAEDVGPVFGGPDA